MKLVSKRKLGCVRSRVVGALVTVVMGTMVGCGQGNTPPSASIRTQNDAEVAKPKVTNEAKETAPQVVTKPDGVTPDSPAIQSPPASLFSGDKKETTAEPEVVGKSSNSGANEKTARFIARRGFNAIPEVTPFAPAVSLSEEHRRMCLLSVGDSIASLTATDLTGKPKQLGELLEAPLTVVVFWNDKYLFAREQFDRLPTDIVQRFGGVDVIAVNTGDSLERVKEIVGSSPPVLCLADENGAAFAKLGTNKLPRTYLVNQSGTILWFDIEYSRASRRELDNAIHFLSKPSR